MMIRWPLVWRRSYDAVKTENFVLRDALREANNELRRYRLLVGGLRTGAIDIVSDKLKTKEKT